MAPFCPSWRLGVSVWWGNGDSPLFFLPSILHLEQDVSMAFASGKGYDRDSLQVTFWLLFSKSLKLQEPLEHRFPKEDALGSGKIILNRVPQPQPLLSVCITHSNPLCLAFPHQELEVKNSPSVVLAARVAV